MSALHVPGPISRRLAGLILPLLLVACAGVPPASPTIQPTVGTSATPSATELPSQSPPPSESATPITLPSDTPSTTPAIGLPSAGCVNGWQAVGADSAIGATGLALLAGYMGLAEPLEVVGMRYFTGPDVPWIIEPHYEVVQRWYIKATLPSDATFRGRWLLEQRSEQVRGLSAVAPFDSTGYQSPDWLGFVGEGPPTTYPNIPGAWAGIAYDFVTGEGDSGQPGLPDEVIDCLAGT